MKISRKHLEAKINQAEHDNQNLMGENVALKHQIDHLKATILDISRQRDGYMVMTVQNLVKNEQLLKQLKRKGRKSKRLGGNGQSLVILASNQSARTPNKRAK